MQYTNCECVYVTTIMIQISNGYLFQHNIKYIDFREPRVCLWEYKYKIQHKCLLESGSFSTGLS